MFYQQLELALAISPQNQATQLVKNSPWFWWNLYCFYCRIIFSFIRDPAAPTMVLNGRKGPSLAWGRGRKSCCCKSDYEDPPFTRDLEGFYGVRNLAFDSQCFQQDGATSHFFRRNRIPISVSLTRSHTTWHLGFGNARESHFPRTVTD